MDGDNDGSAFRDERQFQTKLFGDVEVVVKGKFSAAMLPRVTAERPNHHRVSLSHFRSQIEFGAVSGTTNFAAKARQG